MTFAGHTLARRIESAEAWNGVECSQAQARLRPDLPNAVQGVAGGYAIFLGSGSPLTHALGLGMDGRVSDAEMDSLELFYRSRNSPVTLEICPLAHASLLDLIARRAYRLTEFANVMVRVLSPGETFESDERVRRAETHEAQAWATAAGQGFFEHETLTDEEVEVGLALFHMPSTQCFFGALASTAALSIQNGVACLFADSSMPSARRQGLHAALIRARLAVAAAAGCDIATASTLPGSVSQRNYERAGFQVAYTRLVVTL